MSSKKTSVAEREGSSLREDYRQELGFYPKGYQTVLCVGGGLCELSESHCLVLFRLLGRDWVGGG